MELILVQNLNALAVVLAVEVAQLCIQQIHQLLHLLQLAVKEMVFMVLLQMVVQELLESWRLHNDYKKITRTQ